MGLVPQLNGVSTRSWRKKERKKGIRRLLLGGMLFGGWLLLGGMIFGGWLLLGGMLSEGNTVAPFYRGKYRVLFLFSLFLSYAAVFKYSQNKLNRHEIQNTTN